MLTSRLPCGASQVGKPPPPSALQSRCTNVVLCLLPCPFPPSVPTRCGRPVGFSECSPTHPSVPGGETCRVHSFRDEPFSKQVKRIQMRICGLGVSPLSFPLMYGLSSSALMSSVKENLISCQSSSKSCPSRLVSTGQILPRIETFFVSRQMCSCLLAALASSSKKVNRTAVPASAVHTRIHLITNQATVLQPNWPSFSNMSNLPSDVGSIPTCSGPLPAPTVCAQTFPAISSFQQSGFVTICESSCTCS